MERQVKDVVPRFTHRKGTDIAHIDVAEPLPGDPIEVIEAGDEFGFPGQILVRKNPRTGTIYGITIQGYASFKRKLMWKHRTLRVQAALNALVKKVLEMCGKREHRVPALSH
jgi:hypothetical protein